MKTLSESSLQTPRKLQEATVLLLTTTTHCCATHYLSQNSEQCRQSENGIRESALVGLYHMWIVHQETSTKSEVIYFFFYIFTFLTINDTVTYLIYSTTTYIKNDRCIPYTYSLALWTFSFNKTILMK